MNKTGDVNSGNWNTGDGNSGNGNSGYYNTGDRNSGDVNSGYYNTGDRNPGDRNSGNYNSGYYNSGHWNTGNYNTGNWNSSDHNSGIFNTTSPKLRAFNKETDIELNDFKFPYLELKLTELVGGILVESSYHEAWKLAWKYASPEKKDEFLNLPNFDSEIFKEITGIDVEEKQDYELNDLDKLSKESLIEIINQLKEKE